MITRFTYKVCVKKLMKKVLLLIFLLSVLSLVSCYEELVDAPVANKSPRTFVALFPDSSLSQQQSSVRLHWWGDDPDGLVIGYFISFEEGKWTFTTRNDSLISFPISGTDTSYLFRVAAVDNFGNGIYDNQIIANGINFGPEPFTDLNGNGIWNPGEPFIDIGAVDPNPAEIVLPLKNSPPVINFLVNANGTTIFIPETTFTAASFGWTLTDLDGDATISKVYIALNDTSQKIELPGNARFVTLKAEPPFASDVVECDVYIGSAITTPYHIKLPNLKLNDKNVFYAFAEDIAGGVSEKIVMPSAASNRSWYVKKPKGEILIIDDNGSIDNSAEFYAAVFDSLGLTNRYDIWDIKLGRTTSTPGVLLPGFISPQFTETMKLFKYVFWYTDNEPTIGPAQVSINNYLNFGGRVLFSMIFPQIFDPRGLSDFLPLDSLSAAPISILQSNIGINPTEAAIAQGYPQLRRDNNPNPVARIRTYFPNPLAAQNLYTLDLAGNPIIGFKSTDSRIIFMGVPLHRSNGDPFKVKDFFDKVLFEEFGVPR